jgi:hypothetical protein
VSKIVWVLGAGFSKSLGGPTLEDALAPEMAGDLAGSFRPAEAYAPLFCNEARAAHWLFNWGIKFTRGAFGVDDGKAIEDGLLRPERLWEDAEQFLSYLDAAGPAEWERLRRPLDYFFGAYVPEPQKWKLPDGLDNATIAVAARRLLAAQSCRFLPGANLGTEQWGPYHRWIRDLVKPQDTVITFNYDLVVERLNAWRQSSNVGPGAVEARLPGDSKAPSGSSAQLLKLHGSVNWQAKGGAEGRIAVAAGEYFALTGRAEEIVIASPGPTKARTAERLGTLWEQGKAALKEADAIVFIGYRFPPSDSQAREQLLGAVRENTAGFLALHVVLGPERGRDVRRMEGLLRNAVSNRLEVGTPQGNISAKQFGLTIHDLYAEDFLSVTQSPTSLIDRGLFWRQRQAK